MRAQLALPGAIKIATDNLVRAGLPLVDAIAQHWELWQGGVPAGTVAAMTSGPWTSRRQP